METPGIHSLTPSPSLIKIQASNEEKSKLSPLSKLFHRIYKEKAEINIDRPQQLLNILDNTSKKSNKFKHLYKLLVLYASENRINESNLSSEQIFFAQIYKKIEIKFREIEHDESLKAWIQKADLLDAIDFLVEQNPSLKPISVLMIDPNSEKPWEKSTIPLIPYDAIENTVKKIDKIGPEKLKTLSAVQNELKEVVVTEHSSVKMVQKMTKQGFVGAKILGKFYRFVTSVIGLVYRHPHYFMKTVEQIAQFSKITGIKSIEILSKKIADDGSKQFYYRGPRYLFGQSVHEYKTVNDWFKRDLQSAAREEYLGKVKFEEFLLNSRFGNTPYDRFVISNADSRLRFHHLEQGHFGKSQELTGKVLNTDAEVKAKRSGDDPTYYKEKYKFNTKNLLGRESSDEMHSQALSQALVDEFKLQTNLKPKKTQKLLIQAQHELLGGIYRAFNREGAIQVVQRLAPADIHNYVAPVTGTPLSHREAILLLKARTEKMMATKNNLTEEQKNDLEREIEIFQQLEEVFNKQEELLGRPSQSTVDIYGTNASVSTLAIKNQSRILAQNDRKVMLFKHDDGSFSLHVFIGATGVNKVNVAPDVLPKKQGEWQGDMQFGSDAYTKKGNFNASTAKTTKDDLKKLKMGERQGSFPMNGSTVISYYLPNDFTLLPKIQQFKDSASYGEGIHRVNIELQVKMGDPILIKTEIAMMDALEKNFPHLFLNAESAQTIWQQLQQLDFTELSEQDKVLLNKLQHLAKNELLSSSESELSERVQQLLEKRLYNIVRHPITVAKQNILDNYENLIQDL